MLKLTKQIKIDNALLNSVTIYNNILYMADGLNHTIIEYNTENEKIKHIKKDFGSDLKRLKEPVHFFINGNERLVSDWHNHRVVYKTGKKYQQIGVPGNLDNNIKNILVWLKSIFTKPKYENDYREIKVSSQQYLFSCFFGVLHIFNIEILKNLYHNFINKNFIKKPNCCIKYGNFIFISQKNNKCVTRYNLITKKTFNLRGNIFGRLGQFVIYNEKLYICDETNSAVHVVDIDMTYHKSYKFSNKKIFSIVFTDDHIILCGRNTLLLCDNLFTIVEEVNVEAEYHGICFDKIGKCIYVADRSNSKVDVYEYK